MRRFLRRTRAGLQCWAKRSLPTSKPGAQYNAANGQDFSRYPFQANGMVSLERNSSEMERSYIKLLQIFPDMLFNCWWRDKTFVLLRWINSINSTNERRLRKRMNHSTHSNWANILTVANSSRNRSQLFVEIVKCQLWK